MSEPKKGTVTVMLTGGCLPLEIMSAAYRLAEKYSLKVYFSTMQNLRLADVPEGVIEEVKDTLTRLGANLKAPGKFPVPRVCEGRNFCNLGTVETGALSQRILDKFSGRTKIKGKFKIAISACMICCSGAKTTDIGIIGTREGFDVYVGGKGGQSPKIGKRIQKNIDEDKVLDVIDMLVDFHDKKTIKKQRFFKLLADPEFPFKQI